MKKYDRITSVVWLGFAVYICVESIRLPLGSFHDPGPGFLPLLVGIILAGLSVVCFQRAQTVELKGQGESWYSQERWKNLIWVLLTLFAYALTLDHLGFLIGTFLFLAFLFRLGMGPQKWFWAIGGSLMASLSCYAVFELWLQTQLPKGILGF
jgi:putative tricarboxylic transport membrane protein